jgi:hypothetical protein
MREYNGLFFCDPNYMEPEDHCTYLSKNDGCCCDPSRGRDDQCQDNFFRFNRQKKCPNAKYLKEDKKLRFSKNSDVRSTRIAKIFGSNMLSVKFNKILNRKHKHTRKNHKHKQQTRKNHKHELKTRKNHKHKQQTR